MRIVPLQPEDLPELSRFLRQGFGAPPDAPFADEAVLRWKYLDPIEGQSEPRSLIARHEDRIVGHVGICATHFIAAGQRQATKHLIDWLAPPSGTPAGPLLLFKALAGAETSFAIGGTQEGQDVVLKAGYRPAGQVPLFQRVENLSYLRNGPRYPPAWKIPLRQARDASLWLRRRGTPPQRELRLVPLATFGPEIDEFQADSHRDHVHTLRTAARLNHLLRHPHKPLAGWQLQEGTTTVGFGVTGITRRGRLRVGKIVDCVLAEAAPSLWHAALHQLSRVFAPGEIDVVTCYGGTPELDAALGDDGFFFDHDRALVLRDPKQLLPNEPSFLFSQLEADHGYL